MLAALPPPPTHLPPNLAPPTHSPLLRCCWARAAPSAATSTPMVSAASVQRCGAHARGCRVPESCARAGLGDVARISAEAAAARPPVTPDLPTPPDPCPPRRPAGVVLWEIATGQTPIRGQLRDVKCVQLGVAWTPRCAPVARAACVACGCGPCWCVAATSPHAALPFLGAGCPMS